MKLIKYELRKHFLKSPVVFVILLFLIINMIKIYDVYKDQGFFSEKNLSDFKEVYWNCYQDFGGKITNEKIEKLMSIYNSAKDKIKDQTISRDYDEDSYTFNAYSDEIFFRWCFVNEMKYDYYYKSYADELVNNALNNMKFYRSVDNSYEYNKNSQIAVHFTNREITSFNYTEKYLYYLQYDFSIILILLICIYGLSNVFILEKETDMNQLLVTTVLGGKKTTLAKILSSIIFAFAVCVLFWIVDYISFSVFFESFDSNSSPLYGLKLFQNTLLNMELLQFSALSNFIKTLGVLLFCILILFVSSIFRKSLYSYIVSFVIFGILIMSGDVVFLHGNIIQKILNPVFLLKNRELFKEAEYLNILDIPVPICNLSIIISLFYMLFLCIGIKVSTRKSVLEKHKK
jgi:hypothetical protein